MKLNVYKAIQMFHTTTNYAQELNSYYVASDPDGNAPLSVYAARTSEHVTGMAMAEAIGNQNWFDAGKLAFDKVVDLISKDPLTYEEYLETISQTTDEKIIEITKENNLKYIAGECILTVDRKEKAVNHVVKLYFKNSNNKWVLEERKGKTLLLCFWAEALDGGISDIENAGEMKFPILKPEALK